MKTTRHYSKDRKARQEFIKSHIGYGKVVDIEVIDKGHKNGPEFHVLTSTGIIEVYNYFTHKHITDMVARPGQILREFADVHKSIISKARYHVKMGWNYV